MLAGVGAVDACLFVVAASEGWKPQSEEHLRILEVLGVRNGVVALTKIDLLDTTSIEAAELDVAAHVAGSFLEGAQVTRVAVPEGAGAVGLDGLRQALDELVASTPARPDRGRPRLWVDRAFSARGAGTVVTGTLAGGSFAAGDAVVVGPAERPARIRTIQSLGRTVDRIGPGHRVALNLTGVARTEVTRGDAVVGPDRWRPTSQLDASLHVLAALGHNVSRRGAYSLHLGSGEQPVRLRVLGDERIAAGATGLVRLYLRTPLPLLPGDRYVLRESGRDETVGGGEILDVAPVRPASKAHPDGRVERVVAERGWIDGAELERLTGEQRPLVVGRWVVDPDVLFTARAALEARLADGFDVSTLDERDRALLDERGDVVIVGSIARRRDAPDPLAEHPAVAALAAGGLAPEPPVGIERAELRELVRRGVLVERDGLWWHADAVGTAAALAATLLASRPTGFTVSEFREAAGISRKHAVPLLAELDSRGITRRREDRRIAGNLLPSRSEPS
jgi:selenocysteine-specific elongation factor